MAFAIAFGSLLILGGRASDLYGRRRMFSWGIGVPPQRRCPAAWPAIPYF